MSSRSSGIQAFLTAAVYHALGRCARANTTGPAGGQDTGINIVTYNVGHGGSCPSMYQVGGGLLDALANTPKDASILEEYFLDPHYGTIKDYISSHQNAINAFIFFLWVLFLVVILATVLVFLLRRVKRCGGDDKQAVTKVYMVAYLAYVISLIILLIIMFLLLICLFITRDSLVGALYEKVPDVYSTVFANLRLFVNMTADQVSDAKNLTLSPNATRALGVGFNKAFKSFVADSVMADLNVPLQYAARECANDMQSLGRAFHSQGLIRQSIKLRSLADRCGRVNSYHDELFSNVARKVGDATAADRRRLLEELMGAEAIQDQVNDTERSLGSIDTLEAKISRFEAERGVYHYFEGKLMNWLLFLLLLISLSWVLLAVCLLYGICVHRQSIRPYKRSSFSHFLGFAFVAIAYIFIVLLICIISTSIYLTAYNALGHCFFCSPYETKNYGILDDALERLWPSSHRGYIFSKITPTEVFTNCRNESVSIFDLKSNLSKQGHYSVASRNLFHEHGVYVPEIDAEKIFKSVSLLGKRDYDNSLNDDSTDPLNIILSLPKAMYLPEFQHYRDPLNSSGSILKKWSHLGATINIQRLHRTTVERVVLPRVPAYFSNFIEIAMNSSSFSTSVIGPCSIINDILTSFMDTVCKLLVAEVVTLWSALLHVMIASILIIPLCFLLSKYFFRTRKRKQKRKRSKPERTRDVSTSTEQTKTSTGLSSSGITQRVVIRHVPSEPSFQTIPRAILRSISAPSALRPLYRQSSQNFSVPQALPEAPTICPHLSHPPVYCNHPVPTMCHQHHHACEKSSLSALHYYSCGCPVPPRLRRESFTTLTASDPVRRVHSRTTNRSRTERPAPVLASAAPPQVIFAAPPPMPPQSPILIPQPLVIQPPTQPQVFLTCSCVPLIWRCNRKAIKR